MILGGSGTPGTPLDPPLLETLLMAPTGVAAFNIGGLTIYRALNLPVEHGRNTRYRPLNAEMCYVKLGVVSTQLLSMRSARFPLSNVVLCTD